MQDVGNLYATVAKCSPVASSRVDAGDPGMPQKSVIGRIMGSGDSARQIVLISGHYDSGNFFYNNQSTFTNNGTENPLWATLPAPGADDDLSGSISVLEMFRTLVRSGFRPQRTLEFVAFSGEERGIFEGKIVGTAGSQALADRYLKLGYQVVAMLNLDSIGKNFVVSECAEVHCHNIFNIPNDYTIALFGNVSGWPTDPTGARVSPILRDLIVDSIAKFTTRPIQYGPGPMTSGVGSVGASDFASFFTRGYPANGMVESDIARNLGVDGYARQIHHTQYDTVDRINFDYLKEVAIASLSAVIEVSFAAPNQPVKIDLTNVDQVCSLQFR